MKKQLYWPVAIAVVVTLLFSSISCAPKPTPPPAAKPPTATPSTPAKPPADKPSAQIPVVPTIKLVGPPTFNLPGTTTQIKISKQNGATYQQNGVSIVVPPGATSSDTTMSIKEFTQSPPVYVAPKSGDPLPTAVSIGKVYDLGPEGIKFNKPVQVTIPYDKTLLSSDVDENKIALFGYNGKDWLLAGGLVDTQKGTVTVAMEAFPGEPVTVCIVVGLGIIGAIGFAIAGYKVYEHVEGDPISNNKAKDYVMPNNPVVITKTKEAGIQTREGGALKWVPLEDPYAAGRVNPEFVKSVPNINPKDQTKIGIGGSSKSMGQLPVYNEDKADAWKQPDKYLTSGMKGDCTSIASAYLSMLRRLGIAAYGVDGNKTIRGQGDVRHVWVEFVIDGKVYYYDNDEGIQPLSAVEPNLKRPTGVKGVGFMWDENGQKPYVKDWGKSVPPAKAELKITPATLTGETDKDYAFNAVISNAPERSRVDWFVDGTKKQSGASVIVGNTSVGFKTTFTSEGSHTIVAKLFDAAGKELQSAQVTASVKRPVASIEKEHRQGYFSGYSIRITSPAHGAKITSSKLRVNIDYSAPANPPSGLKVMLNFGAAGRPAKGDAIQKAISASGSASFDVDISRESSGGVVWLSAWTEWPNPPGSRMGAEHQIQIMYEGAAK